MDVDRIAELEKNIKDLGEEADKAGIELSGSLKKALAEIEEKGGLTAETIAKLSGEIGGMMLEVAQTQNLNVLIAALSELATISDKVAKAQEKVDFEKATAGMDKYEKALYEIEQKYTKLSEEAKKYNDIVKSTDYDSLINTLVEKGTLNEKEAEALRKLIKEYGSLEEAIKKLQKAEGDIVREAAMMQYLEEAQKEADKLRKLHEVNMNDVSRTKSRFFKRR